MTRARECEAYFASELGHALPWAYVYNLLVFCVIALIALVSPNHLATGRHLRWAPNFRALESFCRGKNRH